MSLTARRPNISTVAKPIMPPKIPKKVIAPLRVIAISPKQSIKRHIRTIIENLISKLDKYAIDN
jgi:hypothetical protein